MKHLDVILISAGFPVNHNVKTICRSLRDSFIVLSCILAKKENDRNCLCVSDSCSVILITTPRLKFT